MPVLALLLSSIRPIKLIEAVAKSKVAINIGVRSILEVYLADKVTIVWEFIFRRT